MTIDDEPASTRDTTSPVSLRTELETLHPSSFAWAMTCCDRVRAEAEDVLQSAYAKVIAGEARFDGRARFRTWLFGVIRITAREHRRRSVLRALGLSRLRAEPVHTSTPSGEELTEASLRARALVEALAALSERQREVLHLVFYEDLTVREAADVMGVSSGTASLHYDRGKQRLAELLRRRGIEP
ncbi:RNA polymerase sigma factor [Sandaracinus amylolyticus]|uniref:RNA polymerase sigma factor n=1 Tax=Sandaracinus amylolyticus TaxID=927083 RepID=UPI001F285DEB|nr:sigma-70 family RNA polymerase sigma factor [Sandaracinus amylolyticus]